MKTLELLKKKPRDPVEVPPLTPEENALVTQVMSGAQVYDGTIERFLFFVQSRRDVIDTILNEEPRLTHE